MRNRVMMMAAIGTVAATDAGHVLLPYGTAAPAGSREACDVVTSSSIDLASRRGTRYNPSVGSARGMQVAITFLGLDVAVAHSGWWRV